MSIEISEVGFTSLVESSFEIQARTSASFTSAPSNISGMPSRKRRRISGRQIQEKMCSNLSQPTFKIDQTRKISNTKVIINTLV